MKGDAEPVDDHSAKDLITLSQMLSSPAGIHQLGVRDPELDHEPMNLASKGMKMTNETAQHRQLKEIVLSSLKEFCGAGLAEYPHCGNVNDVYAVTSDNIRIFVENVWTSTENHFYHDLVALQRSDADVKILIVNPRILGNDTMKREFVKTKFREIERGVVIPDMIDGYLILENSQFVNEGLRGIVEKSVEEARRRKGAEWEKDESATWLKAHYSQLAEEIYEKWFERPSSLSIADIKTEYFISSLATITYCNGKVTSRGLREPTHANRRIVYEAVEHLKYYPEIWSLWSNATKDVEENLACVKTLWADLLDGLTKRLSVDCPQLVAWDGRGPRPVDYYSLRMTFLNLWIYVERGRSPTDLLVTPEADHYTIADLAETSSMETAEKFLQVIHDLARDGAIQERMKTISVQKNRVEIELEKFRDALANIADDVRRKHKQLNGSCPTCEPWIKKEA